MSRVFLSHSSRDALEALALKTWLERAEPGLVGEIFVDLDPDTGIPAGVRWKEALRKANDRCEAVICLVSRHWDASHECRAEYRTAEDRGKPIFPVRLEPTAGRDITGEWQRCDLFGEGAKTVIEVEGRSESVEFVAAGLVRLQKGLRAIGIAPDTFAWPPENEPDRAPYRGWQPLEAVDAAVYFGRDAEINRALTAIRQLRTSGDQKLFVILGPSGVGKSSFLRAGLLPRLQRDDRHFLPMDIVRPQRHPLTGDHGLARSIHALRTRLGLTEPGLGRIKSGVRDLDRVRRWLVEAQHAAVERFVEAPQAMLPTIVLPVDQAEELFGADASEEARDFLTTSAGLPGLVREGLMPLPIVVIATVRADRYEPLQTAPQLAGLERVFDDLRPMPPDRYREVICGPAARAQRAGSRLRWAPELVERLLTDCASGADALPLLSLTLARLYEDYGGGVVGPAEYEAMGGMRRVVETEIDGLLSADPDIRQRELQQLHDAFIPWLATINPANDQPLRRPARWADLPAASHLLIEALVARRLLVKDERDGEVIVEVALESLLRQWDALAGWLREEAADLKHTDTIEQAARAWDDNARRDDWLLPGDRLAEAEALAAKPGFRDRLNTTREYLLASRQREDRRARERQESTEALAAAEQRAKLEAQNHARVLARRARVLRVLLVLVAVIAVVAVAGGVWAWKAQHNADARSRDAIALALDAGALQTLTGGSRTGVGDLLADQMILAARSFPSVHRADDFYLLSALQQQRSLIKLIDLPSLPTRAVFSGSDDARIVSAHADGLIRQWDAESGRPIGSPLGGHVENVNAVDSTRDGTRLVSGGIDGTVRLWDAVKAQPIGSPLLGDTGAAVTSVALSPDGRRVVSGSTDRTVRVWDLANGSSMSLRGHESAVYAVAFSPDGSRVASASTDGTLRVWDANTGLPTTAPVSASEGEGWVTTVAFDRDGVRIASGSTDGTVRIWDTVTGQPIGAPLVGHTSTVMSVAFSPDGSRLASASVDKTIRLWDPGTGREAGILFGHRSGVGSVAFSRDGRRLLSASDDGTLRIWDPLSWQPITWHPGRASGNPAPATAGFTEDGKTVISGDAAAGTVRSWDAATGRPIGPPLRVEGDFTALWPISTRHLLLSEDKTDTLQFRDLATGRPVGPPLSVDFEYKEGVLWSYQSKSHRIAARTGVTTVGVWDAGTMRQIASIDLGETFISVRISPDGRLLATLGLHSTIRLWDVGTGKPAGRPITGDQESGVLQFSYDGKLLAFAGRTMQLWRVDTAQPAGKALPTETEVSAVKFSPDGTTLAAGGIDGSILLWDIKSGKRLGIGAIGDNVTITGIDFSPDGSRFVSTNEDGTIRQWPIPKPSPEALCAKLTHNMSQKDWGHWVSPSIDYVAVCPGLPVADNAG